MHPTPKAEPFEIAEHRIFAMGYFFADFFDGDDAVAEVDKADNVP